jgi:Domain of unknown function (DUF4124)
MRVLLAGLGLLVLSSSTVLAQKLYKHVDADGKIVYTDRPAEAGQKPIVQKSPNVASPEARRQDDYARRQSLREEQAERMAQQQRHLAQRRRDAEAERERRAKEADPYSPIQDPARPRAKR